MQPSSNVEIEHFTKTIVPDSKRLLQKNLKSCHCVCFHYKLYHNNKSYEQDEVELTTCVQWQVNVIIRYIYTTNTY